MRDPTATFFGFKAGLDRTKGPVLGSNDRNQSGVRSGGGVIEGLAGLRPSCHLQEDPTLPGHG